MWSWGLYNRCALIEDTKQITSACFHAADDLGISKCSGWGGVQGTRGAGGSAGGGEGSYVHFSFSPVPHPHVPLLPPHCHVPQHRQVTAEVSSLRVEKEGLLQMVHELEGKLRSSVEEKSDLISELENVRAQLKEAQSSLR